MAHTPPIDRRANRHLLNDERFYKLLAAQCNFMDRDTVFSFYMALVGVIGEDLRRHGMASLPHIGFFALVQQKPKTGWAGRVHLVMASRFGLKFYFKEKFRSYFNKRQGEIRSLEFLPPPALNQVLDAEDFYPFGPRGR